MKRNSHVCTLWSVSFISQLLLMWFPHYAAPWNIWKKKNILKLAYSSKTSILSAVSKYQKAHPYVFGATSISSPGYWRPGRRYYSISVIEYTVGENARYIYCMLISQLSPDFHTLVSKKILNINPYYLEEMWKSFLIIQKNLEILP